MILPSQPVKKTSRTMDVDGRLRRIEGRHNALVKELRKEMTVKAGQKCTAVRRIFVPENRLEDSWKALTKALSQTTIGNPENEKVRMGSLAGLSQREEVRTQVRRLLATSQLVYGSLDSVEVIDADSRKGAFISPLLLLNTSPLSSEEPHEIEAFGPVSTLMPYKGLDEAIWLSKKGKGSLCSSIVTADARIARSYVLGAATHHGRILILNEECAKESTGHGSPLPLLVHGGPGRAGGGEEMGGIRGVKHYMQRVAVQGSPTMLTALTHTYQPHAHQTLDEKHPFRKYFDELQVGDTVITHKRTITEADISNFANLSWDHFYAHTDHTSLEGTLFEKPVALGPARLERRVFGWREKRAAPPLSPPVLLIIFTFIHTIFFIYFFTFVCPRRLFLI